jgi:hypothetical protein
MRAITGHADHPFRCSVSVASHFISLRSPSQKLFGMSVGQSSEKANSSREGRHCEDEWRVEWIDDDGRVEVAIFAGPKTRERAIRYADRQYGLSRKSASTCEASRGDAVILTHPAARRIILRAIERYARGDPAALALMLSPSWPVPVS